jgi:hypothetical protein
LSRLRGKKISRLSIKFLEKALRTSENPEVLEIYRLGEEDRLREKGFG